MQKKLIAVAIAGLASTAAFAQSNVTIYGVADATYDVVRVSSAKTGGNAIGDANVGNYNRVSSNSSYLGFKGAEALGNGLTAVFQFEGGVRTDSASAFAFDRDTFVGVGSGFGTVVLGNLTGPTRALGTALDVNAGATGIGANEALLGKLGNVLTGTTDANSSFGATGSAPCTRSQTCTSLFDTRWKNAIAYVSPSIYGLNLTAAYVANENRTANNAAAKLSTSGYDLGLKYANGPVMAAVTYNAVSLGNNNVAAFGATANHTEVSDFRVGGSFDYSIVSVRALYEQTKAANFAMIGGDLSQKVWGLGATVNVIPTGKIIGQFYKANDLKGTLANIGAVPSSQTGAKLYEIGYEQSLSKRTIVKVEYAGIKNEDNAKYDYALNATGNPGGGAGYTLSGFSVGLRHNF